MNHTGYEKHLALKTLSIDTSLHVEKRFSRQRAYSCALTVSVVKTLGSMIEHFVRMNVNCRQAPMIERNVLLKRNCLSNLLQQLQNAWYWKTRTKKCSCFREVPTRDRDTFTTRGLSTDRRTSETIARKQPEGVVEKRPNASKPSAIDTERKACPLQNGRGVVAWASRQLIATDKERYAGY